MRTPTFVEQVAQRTLTVGIVGLGYVGLPLMLSFVQRGFRVIGFDIDPAKVATLAGGGSYIRHVSGDAVATALALKRFEPTADFTKVAQCGAVLMCVPTPLNRNREPDMTYIRGTARSIAPHLRRGTLVVLESTTYPGTTDDLLRRELEAGGPGVAGEDFHLAFSPEREDPGNPGFHTETIPKVVGGLTRACRDHAEALYGAVMHKVVAVSSTRVAEMSKLLENIFRSVNIALVNELKMLADAMHIDIWEVVEAAATKPFGFMPFFPGPGLGGHCIPIDPFYLTWKAREYAQPTRFIELAGEINQAMPAYVLDRLAWALDARGKPVNGSHILILGVAYKRNVDDMRESPALRIMTLLLQRGARVDYHDPFVPTLPPTRQHTFKRDSIALTPETLGQADAVVIVTDHGCVDYAEVVRHAPLVVDTRNATSHVTDGRERIVKA